MVSLLEETYQKIKSEALAMDEEIEPFEIIKTIHDYRFYFKPEKVKTILLAESHVWTSLEDFQCALNPIYQFPGYPERYTRFVYCLGYGENEMLKQSVTNNGGTPGYWKLFYSCLYEINPEKESFRSILKKTSFGDRRANKIKLLQDLKKKGVWLLDASIVAIYKGSGERAKYGEKAIHYCWDFIRDILRKEKPERLICVGKTVTEEKLRALKNEDGLDHKQIYQPSRRRDPRTTSLSEFKEQTMKDYKTCYDVCNMENVK